MKVADRPCMLLPGGPQKCSCPQGQVLNSTHLLQHTHSLFTCSMIHVTAFCLWSSETADTAFPLTQHPPAATNPCTEPIPALAASWYDVGVPKGVQRYRQEFFFIYSKAKRIRPLIQPLSCWELLSPIPRLRSSAAVVSDAYILLPPLPPASQK